MPKKADGLPSRNQMRKDNNLAHEISRKTGHLKVVKRGGQLRKYRGDARLRIDDQLWKWLCGDDDQSSSNDSQTANDEEVAREASRAQFGLRSRQ
jgi:hypothetical protein